MRIETAHLPEFGMDVSWAMCRNPMCANFGIHFEGTIPKDRKQGTVKLTGIHSFSTRSQFEPTRQISDLGGMSISETSRK